MQVSSVLEQQKPKQQVLLMILAWLKQPVRWYLLLTSLMLRKLILTLQMQRHLRRRLKLKPYLPDWLQVRLRQPH